MFGTKVWFFGPSAFKLTIRLVWYSVSFLCFQMQCFQYTNLCFQYKMYISNIQILFPNAFICFQYPICVSNIRSMFPNENDVSKLQCFQCMFPIYIEPEKRNFKKRKCRKEENYMRLLILVRMSHLRFFCIFLIHFHVTETRVTETVLHL